MLNTSKLGLKPLCSLKFTKLAGKISFTSLRNSLMFNSVFLKLNY
jgi:hypothetical protein